MMETSSTTQNKPHEGGLTRSVENQTAKIPSMAWLIAAGGALALSATLALTNRNKGWANFVGEWVPTLLLLGVYNKIVKMEAEGSRGLSGDWSH